MKTAKQLDVPQGESARFWSHVDTTGNCWLWTGCLNKKGYGSFGIPLSPPRPGKKTSALAHRVSWVLANKRPLPAQLLVLHSLACVSRACVRPDHLRLGTQKENMADTKLAGTRALIGRPGQPKSATHRRSLRLAIRRPDGTMMPRVEATEVIRGLIFARANGACEGCGAHITNDSGQMDHQWGRAKRSQTVQNCWALCATCHESKTDARPSRHAWLLRFAEHAQKHNYPDEVEMVRIRVAVLHQKGLLKTRATP